VLEEADLLVFQRPALNEIIVPFLNNLFHGPSEAHDAVPDEAPAPASNLAFFQGLSEEESKAIACEVGLEWYDDGDYLFNQGDPADALYIVIAGKVAIIKEDIEDGKSIKTPLTTYSWGTSFGERGVLSGERRAASARIEQRTALLVLPSEKVAALANKYVGVALGLYRNLAHQLEEESKASRLATRQIEKVTGHVQSAKMAALGQLVAGLAHELNTPVAIINSDSHQLERRWMRVKQYYDRIPHLIQEFYEQNNLQAVADNLGYVLNDHTRNLVKEYVAQQLNCLKDAYEKASIERYTNNIHEISEELKKASDFIKSIVKDLGNFSRLDEAEIKHVDVHEGLDSTIALLHHELKYNVEVKKEYDALPKIACYPNQLNQVFMNLLMNAIQALERGKLQEKEKGLIQIRTYQEGGWAVIAITDNGKGIPPENLDRIFDPFFSTKSPVAADRGLGLGLGLPISRKIVQEQHLGRLEVQSTPHKETTFFIKLPLDGNQLLSLHHTTK
jgi:signal transduction histidine kinase